MEKIIQITEVSKFKEGNTNRKDWCIFKVQCNGDNEMSEFTTFDDHRDKIGQQFKSNFEFNSQYKNWGEVSEKKAKDNSKHDEIMNALRIISDKIDALGVPRTEDRISDEELQQDEANSQHK